MSNIRIDNPQRLLALAEQMNGFQNAFGKFIENMRNAVKTTMDQLKITRINPYNFVLEDYDIADRNLIDIDNIENNFNPQKDYIEYFISI